METENILDVDVDNLPSGYILIRKEDGVFAFLKMEPEDQAQIEVETNQGVNQEMEVEEQMEYLHGDENGDEIVQEEVDIDVIPDAIVEDFPPDLSPARIEETVTNDQVEFIEETVTPSPESIRNTSPKRPQVERQFPKAKTPSTYSSQMWKGITIPPNLKGKELEKFKTAHLLQRLSDRVTRNRQKVLIYGNKNESLRKLISNQREQMLKMGFHTRDIARFHNMNRKPERLPPPVSPDLNDKYMTEKDQMDAKMKRLEADYAGLRRKLKSLLSSHRRYKKVFVENHEKILKGPNKQTVQPGIKRENQLMQLASVDDSDSDEGGPGSAKNKQFRCYHCKYGADTKREIRAHVEGHLTQRRYECPACPYYTTRITPFLDHMKQHPEARAFACKSCNFKTAYPAALRNHELTHLTVKPLKCPHCRYRCSRSDHLRNHMRKHGSVRSFKCTLCSFSSKFSSGLSKHTKFSHPEEWDIRRSKGKGRAATYKTEPIKTEEPSEESEEGEETTEIEIDETGKMLYIRTIGKSSTTKEPVVPEGRRMALRRSVKKKVMVDYVEGDEFDEGGHFMAGGMDEDGDDFKLEGVDEEDEEFEEGMEDEVECAEGEEERLVEDRLDDGEIVEDEDDEIIYAQQDDGGDDDEEEEQQQDDDVEEEDSDAQPQSQPYTFPKDLLSSYVIYQCIFCDFSCEMKQGLIEHVNSHMENWTFTCKICPFIASNPRDLRTHSDDHKYEGENTCPYCDHVAPSKDKLKKHAINRHPPGQPLACSYCDYISSNRRSMKIHMLGHRSKKVWQCLICSYKAPFRSSLKRHLRKHTGERPYHCQLCEFNASQYSHLTRHLRKYHPDAPNPPDTCDFP